ncbi:hypothetical protein M0R45_000203 [Rubus argutus]|uniref:peptidylprolyl isomerase n=1 Tax=Rubus argutus TaxID=59490 RepID=A0AAW1VTV1_RUBAR
MQFSVLACQSATRIGFGSTLHHLFSRYVCQELTIYVKLSVDLVLCKYADGKVLKYLPSICMCCIIRYSWLSTEDTGVSSTQSEDLSIAVTTTGTNGGELKISVEVSGAKTQAIFDDVFDKMVAAAQPIPGFRRGKHRIYLETFWSKSLDRRKYKQVIKKVINSTIAEYVEKEGLEVRKDLRVEQSFEDLAASFEAGEKFSFDAVVHLQK